MSKPKSIFNFKFGEFQMEFIKRKKSDTGLEIGFVSMHETDQGIVRESHTVKSKSAPHGDLLSCLDKLKPYMGFSAGYGKPEDITPEKLEQIYVSGVVFQHGEEGFTALLTGGLQGPCGFSAYNTPNMKMTENEQGKFKHGWEPDCLEVLEDLKTCAYKFLVEGVRAQATFFDQEETDNVRSLNGGTEVKKEEKKAPHKRNPKPKAEKVKAKAS